MKCQKNFGSCDKLPHDARHKTLSIETEDFSLIIVIWSYLQIEKEKINIRSKSHYSEEPNTGDA